MPKCASDTVAVQIKCSGCKYSMLRMHQSHCAYTDHVLDELCTDADPTLHSVIYFSPGDPEVLW